METINKDYCSKCKKKDVPFIKVSTGINKEGTKVQYYRCRSCNRAQFSRYYHKNKEKVKAIIKKSIAKHSHKQAARIKLNYAVKTGKIVKPTACTKCGIDSRIEGHHNDYSKPLEVTWLCPGCHGDIDREQNENKNI